MLLICSCQNNGGGWSLGKLIVQFMIKEKGLPNFLLEKKNVDSNWASIKECVLFEIYFSKNFEEKPLPNSSLPPFSKLAKMCVLLEIYFSKNFEEKGKEKSKPTN